MDALAAVAALAGSHPDGLRTGEIDGTRVSAGSETSLAVTVCPRVVTVTVASAPLLTRASWRVPAPSSGRGRPKSGPRVADAGSTRSHPGSLAARAAENTAVTTGRSALISTA